MLLLEVLLGVSLLLWEEPLLWVGDILAVQDIPPAVRGYTPIAVRRIAVGGTSVDALGYAVGGNRLLSHLLLGVLHCGVALVLELEGNLEISARLQHGRIR